MPQDNPSPTTKEAPAKAPDESEPSTPATDKPKKKTPTELKAELADLEKVAGERQRRLRDHEIARQRAVNILKKEGTPGMNMMQDHYRLTQMINELRTLFDVKPEQIGG